MSFSPIAFTIPNYRDYSDWWLKAYEPGTTTPKNIALDSDGSTLVAKVQLNSDGFTVSAGSAFVIPFVSGSYDLWLFPTESEADANDTVNALQFADNIQPAATLEDAGNLPADTVADMVARDLKLNTTIERLGYYSVNDGGAASYVIVAGGTGTDDGGSYITLDNGLQAQLIRQDTISTRVFGILHDGTAASSNTLQFNRLLTYASNQGVNIIATGGTILTEGIEILSFNEIQMQGNNCTIKLADSTNKPVVKVDGGNRFKFTGFILDGNKTNQNPSARLDGAGLIVNGVTRTSIRFNTFKQVSTGSAIVASSSDPTNPNTHIESCEIIFNEITSCGDPAFAFTCDAIFVSYDNAVVERNKIHDVTDSGVACDFSYAPSIKYNRISSVESAVTLVGTTFASVTYNKILNVNFSGILVGTFGNPQTPPFINEFRNIVGNKISGVLGSVAPGDTTGISIQHSTLDVDFVVNDNQVDGGDYNISIEADGVICHDNRLKNANLRPILSDTNDTVEFYNNTSSGAPSRSFISNTKGSSTDFFDSNIQKRTFRGQTTNPSFYRACYVKTNDTTGFRSCIVNLYAMANIAAGAKVVFRQIRITENAGTLTLTDTLPYSGDTADITVTIGATATPSQAEVIAQPAVGTADMNVYVEVISMDGVDNFYIQEA